MLALRPDDINELISIYKQNYGNKKIKTPIAVQQIKKITAILRLTHNFSYSEIS